MNVSQNRNGQLKRVFISALFTLFVFILSTQSSFAQNYVNADQAAQILKQELVDLEGEGFTAYNNGEYSKVYDLGYQYRYVQEMLKLLDAGSNVPDAVENGLPTVPFEIGNLETGQSMSESNLNARRDALRQYAGNLLVL